MSKMVNNNEDAVITYGNPDAQPSVFATLSAINCNDHTETKNGLTYLSWAWAWHHIKKHYPLAFYTIYETPEGRPYFDDGRTAWVKTGVTIEGIEHIEYLPIMDYNNKSITIDRITSFDMNKSIQRSLTKACARHGLGLYIYAGEDLPDALDEEKRKEVVKAAPARKAPAKKAEPTYEQWVEAIALGKVTPKGVSAKDAWMKRAKPTLEQVEQMEQDVLEYKRNHNL